LSLKRSPSSFRDPSGYVFLASGEVYRNIDRSYQDDYEALEQSGLLQKLFDSGLLVRHEEVSGRTFHHSSTFKVIKPERIPVVIYPYEWSFSQLQQAALLTLEVLRLSLEHDLILKDASAYNIQFKGFKPIFIDTLSFAKYREGQPWNGYKQFCEHFLAPLYLIHYRGAWYQSLLKINVEGIALPFVSTLLPLTSWFNTAALFHIHLHAKSITHYQDNAVTKSEPKRVSKRNLLAMIHHLTGAIEHLKFNHVLKTEWQNYDLQTHYSLQDRERKTSVVLEYVNRVNPTTVWDIGANDGYFSRIVSAPHRIVLSMDSDPIAIEKNYIYATKERLETVYPVLYDAVNPSPGLGWANEERSRLSDRSKADMIMALALIHHLTITYNVPFRKVAEYMHGLAEWLIIEFVPAEDEKIRSLPGTAGKMLYSRENFTAGFQEYFDFVDEKQVTDLGRTILLLKRKV
jgi:hypothetical protein